MVAAPRSIAEQSESVFGSREPRNTKFIFHRLRTHILQDLTARLGTVHFVQVGANDGVHGDPIHSFVRSGRWSGILVEPCQEAFAALLQTYAGVPGLQFSGDVLDDSDGSATFYVVEGATVLSSLSLATIRKHAHKYPDLESRISARPVRTTTLDALILERGLPRLDLVTVDAEGCDDRVLGGLSLERWRPILIMFEHVALSRDGSVALKRRLEEAGYTLLSDRHDCLAADQSRLDAGLLDLAKDIVEIAKTN